MCTWECVHVCAYVYTSICVYVYVCTGICVYVYVYVHVLLS